MTDNTPTAWLNVPAAAERRGVHRDTIYRWIASGRLRAYRIGPRRILIDPADLDAMTVPIVPETKAS